MATLVSHLGRLVFCGTYNITNLSRLVFACAMIMFNVASPGALRAYFQGIRRLNDRYPNDWGSIAVMDEEMRSERWDRLRQQYLDGSSTPPADYDAKRPWATIIRDTRTDFLAGPLADWWHENQFILERARSRSSGGTSSSSKQPAAVAPAFPSYFSHKVLPDVAANTNPKVASDAPTAWNPRNPRKRPNPWTNKAANKKPKNDSLKACFICGSTDHLQADCPKNKALPRSGGKSRGKGKKGGRGGKSGKGSKA